VEDQAVVLDERDQAAQFRTLAAEGDWHAFVAALSPDHADSVKSVAQTQLRRGLIKPGNGSAEEIVAALKSEALFALGLSVQSIRGFADALMHSSDTDLLKTLLAQAADIKPDDPVIAGLQVCLFGRLDKISAIRQEMRARPTAFADPHVLILASDHVILKSHEHDRVVEYFEEMPGDIDVQVRLRAVRWLFRAGEAERAERIARRYQGNAGSTEYDGVINILKNIPACESRMAPSDVAPEILVGHSDGDRGVVIVFNGFGRKGRKGNGSVLARYVADLGLSMISVKDPTHLLCLAGIPGVAGTIQESAAILRAIVSDLGIHRIYTMGGSSGGFPAVVYGLELKADGAILFGSPTDCGPANSHIDTRAQVVARKLQKNFDSRTLDMVAWLDDADHELPITLYYAADNRIDSWHANRIADRPNVRAIALEQTSSHHAMVESVRGRTLGEVLSEGLSLPPR
jgi:hypothetical protein